ncbi:MAG: TadG family pilus assembly protein [Myxococcota bacterium]
MSNPTPPVPARPTLRAGRRGNYSILFALTLVMVMGFGALSVDVSLMTMARLQAQAAADSASHAGLVTYLQAADVPTGETAGAVAAQWVVDHANVGLGTPTLKAAPEFGTWNFAAPIPAFGGVDPGDTPNAVRVTVQRVGGNSVPLMLAPFLGVADFEVEATSIAAQEMRALAVVQDMSCSMMGGPAVHESRFAVEAFFDYIAVKRPQPGDLFALTMYASSATKVAGCSPCATTDPMDAPWLPLMPVKGNFNTISAAIDGICDTTTAATCGTVLGVPSPHPLSGDIGQMTNPEPAMLQAVEQLVSGADENYFRGMVVFSDGNANEGNGQAGAVSAADLAWANDINIWTILLTNGGASPANMMALTRGVGFYQGSGDPTEIKAMFEEVARSLPTTFVF